jgi:hypothetical protein
MPQLSYPELAYLAGAITAFVTFGVSLFAVWVYVNTAPKPAPVAQAAPAAQPPAPAPLREAA